MAPRLFAGFPTELCGPLHLSFLLAFFPLALSVILSLLPVVMILDRPHLVFPRKPLSAPDHGSVCVCHFLCQRTYAMQKKIERQGDQASCCSPGLTKLGSEMGSTGRRPGVHLQIDDVNNIVSDLATFPLPHRAVSQISGSALNG